MFNVNFIILFVCLNITQMSRPKLFIVRKETKNNSGHYLSRSTSLHCTCTCTLLPPAKIFTWTWKIFARQSIYSMYQSCWKKVEDVEIGMKPKQKFVSILGHSFGRVSKQSIVQFKKLGTLEPLHRNRWARCVLFQCP